MLQLRSAWDVSRGFLVDGLDSLAAQIGAGYHREHNSDDTHSTVHVTGKIYERARTVAMGEWTVIPKSEITIGFNNPSNTFVVSRTQVHYTLVGSVCLLNFYVEATSTISVGTENEIFVEFQLPVIGPNRDTGSVGEISIETSALVLNAGTRSGGSVFGSVIADGTLSASIEKLTFANFATDGVGQTTIISSQMFLPIGDTK